MPFEEVVGGGVFLFAVTIFVDDPHYVHVVVKCD